MAQNEGIDRVRRRNFIQAVSVLAASNANSMAAAGAGSITDVGGLRVGHYTDARRPTGCTVILFDEGAIAGVDVRGSAPGTRETDLLNPINTVQQVNAILLSGGSAFGLSAADGVMRYLEEHGRGYHVGPWTVPIVPAAILFDLNIGNGKIRPDSQAGYAACKAATAVNTEQGNVGAGAGATVGKLFGAGSAMKSGLGTASLKISGAGLVVGAIVAVNAVGDVRDHTSGKLLAGARDADGKQLRNTMKAMLDGSAIHAQPGGNTTIAVVATNAILSKTEANKMAQMAHDGLARSIAPVHTSADGDTVFAAATGIGKIKVEISQIGALAAEVLAMAVKQAVLAASSIPGYPAYRDLQHA